MVMVDGRGLLSVVLVARWFVRLQAAVVLSTGGRLLAFLEGSGVRIGVPSSLGVDGVTLVLMVSAHQVLSVAAA
jgi:hypothetical protein